MRKQFFVANWKSHKTIEETREWFSDMSLRLHELNISDEQKLIVCPPYPLLSFCHEAISQHHLPITLGSEDISPFPEGAYTGAVSARLLRELVTYTIIGHSERRQYFSETVEILSEKVKMSLASGIEPIYCISNKEEKIPQGVKIVAYEPLSAIGSGHPDSPDDAEAVAKFLKGNNDIAHVLYGGSVTAEDVNSYMHLPSIDGVLVGGASLTPEGFCGIIQHA